MQEPSFYAEACAAYVQLASRLATVDDWWHLDGAVAGINNVIVDLDADCNVLGVELLDRLDHGPQAIRAAIADESIANALAAEGFDCRALRGNPGIAIQHIDRRL